MTIAAGFVTRDGVLLCADTQFTGGAKVYRHKIRAFTLNDGTILVFALAGHLDYAVMAIEECLEAIDAVAVQKSLMRRSRAQSWKFSLT